MKPRRSPVVSNAGPLIHLAKVNLLFLLKDLYGEVVIPDEVKVEVIDRGIEKGFADAVQIRDAVNDGWIKTENMDVTPEFRRVAQVTGLKVAEAEVIHYAYKNDVIALLDEDSARTLARTLGVSVRGTLGIILESLEKGLLSRIEALKALERLTEDMYLSADIYRIVRDEIDKT